MAYDVTDSSGSILNVARRRTDSSTELAGIRQSSRAVFSLDQFDGSGCEPGASATLVDI